LIIFEGAVIMKFSAKFICARYDYNTYEEHIPSPYFRKTFTLDEKPEAAGIRICGLGFYDLFINGKKITKGLLAPYISNPDDIIYYDDYDISDMLVKGENVIGIQLGNGMQNCPGGFVWDFDRAAFRGAPRLALYFEAKLRNGGEIIFEADESFKTADSPLFFDDLRSGAFYDARKEQAGWCDAGFDDSQWRNALRAETPRGQARVCSADPIVRLYEIIPVEIRKATLSSSYVARGNYKTPFKPERYDGYLYDFGVNTAGIIRLKIKGKPGQMIELQFCEYLEEDGKPSYSNIDFYPDGYSQRDIYICKGEGEEIFEPQFTYHGFRYCQVIGIEDEQAKEELLTYIVCSSDIGSRGGFLCSDETANKLYEMAMRSDLANFYYFPTDCPHREKNGWMGDAAVSCEQVTLNFAPEKSYIEWIRNICKAQADDGSLPGIVPTGGWGFKWGNGPAWDCALTFIPYFTYLYRGDKEILKECADSVFRYLNYISKRRDEYGLIKIGLGDWLPAGRPADWYKVPLEFTDSVLTLGICKAAAYIFGELGLSLQQSFAQSLYNEIRSAVRDNLIDMNTMTVVGRSQTGQALALYFDVLEPAEKAGAFKVLMDIIGECGEHLDVGMLGIRALFHVLSEFGQGELAYKMITRRDFPSYGWFVERGLTCLPEDFQCLEREKRPNSLNHHFFGDIANWFMTKVAGIVVNPNKRDCTEVNIKPDFLQALSFAQAHYETVCGKVFVRWERREDGIKLSVEAPPQADGRIILPPGYVFSGEFSRIFDLSFCPLQSGDFLAIKKQMNA